MRIYAQEKENKTNGKINQTKQSNTIRYTQTYINITCIAGTTKQNKPAEGTYRLVSNQNSNNKPKLSRNP